MDILKNEASIRLVFFLGGLLIFGGLGFLFSFRKSFEKSPTRCFNNLILVLINTLLVRFLLPFNLILLAPILQEKQIGFLNFFNASPLVNLIVSFFALDAIIYFQHVVFHHVPWLWRLHRVHHTDIGFDSTTALRFHPIEILLSMFVKFAAVVVLGCSPLAILVFEITLNFCAMFNHGNFSLPGPIEVFLKKILVTPDMHRIHHSVLVKETNSNYGFCLSWWDRIFKTYIQESKVNLQTESVGVEVYRQIGDQRIDRLLIQPFQ